MPKAEVHLGNVSLDLVDKLSKLTRHRGLKRERGIRGRFPLGTQARAASVRLHRTSTVGTYLKSRPSGDEPGPQGASPVAASPGAPAALWGPTRLPRGEPGGGLGQREPAFWGPTRLPPGQARWGPAAKRVNRKVDSGRPSYSIHERQRTTTR